MGRIEGSPEYWISKIKVEPSVPLLKELQSVLASEQLSWITKFIACKLVVHPVLIGLAGEGLVAILDLLGEVEQNLHSKSQIRQLR